MFNINVVSIKYKQLTEPVKAALWFTVCNILQKGISLLTVPLFTRLLTTAQYGEYTVYQSWYSIISIILTLQLAAGVYTKGLLKFEEDQDRFTSSLMGLYSLNVLIWTVIYLVFHNYIDSLLGMKPVYVYAILFECLFAPAVTFWSARERFQYRYKAVIAVTIAIAILSPLIGLWAVCSTEYKAEARILSFVLVQVVFGLVFYIYQLSKGKKLYTKKYWKYALAFNIPLIPHYLSQILLQQADKIMISKYVGSSEAAIYGVAYSLSLLMTIVTTAINYSYVPFAYRELKDGTLKKLNSVCIGILVFVAASLMMIIAIGPELTRIIASVDYYEARWVIPPVAASVFFMFLYNTFSAVEFYYEKTGFTTIITIVSAVVNIITNYIFINLYGYIAAAYTTLGCYILSGIAHYIYANYLLRKNHKGIIVGWKSMTIISLLLLFTMFIFLMIYDFWYIRYSILVCIILFAILLRKRILTLARTIMNK